MIFRAPLPFVYKWCTDYTPQDLKYGGEKGERRIIKRDSKRVIFENLYDVGRGWSWERHTVTLKPPDAWHSEGWGNYSVSFIDYKLSELSNDRTKLDMRWKSKSGMLSEGKKPSRHLIEDYVKVLWRHGAKFVERDFKRFARLKNKQLCSASR